jgi:predicted tellurium resistance membrane protein TerC
VITAIGLAEEVGVMIAAVVVAVLVMMVMAKPISEYVERHPTIKILALSSLLLIGVSLVVEAVEVEIPKGYIYFAMAFSVFVGMLNIRYRSNRPVDLHGVSLGEAEETAAAE